MEPTAEPKALPPSQLTSSLTQPRVAITQKQLHDLRIAENLFHPSLLVLLAQLADGAEIEVTGTTDDLTVRLPLQPGDRFIVPRSNGETAPMCQTNQAG
jgi:hypothetical protein